MSYIFPSARKRPAPPAGQARLVAQSGDLQIELRIVPASTLPTPACEQWLTTTLAQANRWVEPTGATKPLATLLILEDTQRDLEILSGLRRLQPDDTIFAVMADSAPSTVARALDAGADDVWHCTMPAPEAWARLTAAVRRRVTSGC